MGLNWLITGGCGFIGSNLLKNLVEEGGHYIRIIDNLSVGSLKKIENLCHLYNQKLLHYKKDNRFKFQNKSKIDFIEGDILNTKLSVEVSKDIDVIVHLAANTGVDASVKHPMNDCQSNVLGTLNYLEAARINKVKKFIFASSGAPVGNCTPPVHEEIVPHPVSPYGASKLAGEAYCSAYHETFNVETIALRFGNVYGPLSEHKNSVISKFIKLSIQRSDIDIYGDGKQTRDFIYISDLIHAIRLAVEIDGIGGEIFQIATNSETTINELVEKLNHILKIYHLKKLKYHYKPPRLGDVIRNFSDISKARKHLGWKSKIDLTTGLKETVDWFQKWFQTQT